MERLNNEGIIEPARKNGYICPFCGNGTGKHGTGLTVLHKDNGEYGYTCFSNCNGKTYSNVDLLAKKFGYDSGSKEGRKETANKAKEIFHLQDLTFDTERNYSQTKAEFAKENNSFAQVSKNYSDFYKKVQAKLPKFIESKGGKYRGLTLEQWQAGKAGIATADELKAVGEKVPADSEVIILPYNERHFFMRSTAANAQQVKRGNTGGAKEIYNPSKTDFSTQFVFVTEGEIDALTINAVDCGTPAIAVGGANSFKKLPEWLAEKEIQEKPCFILMGDNNDGGAGMKGAAAGVDALLKAGYPAISLILDENSNCDPNEFLQKQPTAIKGRLLRLVNLATERLNSLKKKAAQLHNEVENQENGIDFESYFRCEFDPELEELKKYSDRRTGFDNLDLNQSLIPGLYVVGGLPAVGKTTFMWQMLEQIARQGETCIYCSYEMSRLELFTKSLVRECNKKFAAEIKSCDLLHENSFLTSNGIRRGQFPAFETEYWRKLYNATKKEFAQSGLKNFRVMELREETITELLTKLEEIVKKLTKPPIICIDYLQIIPTDKDTAKSGVDETVRKLKNFQRETGTTFFVISSFNRENYSKDVSFLSFKESGNIEYSADIVFGLQFYFSANSTDEKGNKVDGNKDINRAKFTDAARKETVRPIELKCLKNRNGANYEVYFNYNAACDWFKSCEQSECVPISLEENQPEYV